MHVYILACLELFVQGTGFNYNHIFRPFLYGEFIQQATIHQGNAERRTEYTGTDLVY